jgi:hypothetical protein
VQPPRFQFRMVTHWIGASGQAHGQVERIVVCLMGGYSAAESDSRECLTGDG